MYGVHWVSIVSPHTDHAARFDKVFRRRTRRGAQALYRRIVEFEIQDRHHNEIFITDKDGHRV